MHQHEIPRSRVLPAAFVPALLLACLATTAAADPGQDDGTAEEVKRLRAEMRAMDQRHRAEMAELRRELSARGPGESDLASEIDRLVDRVEHLDEEIHVTSRRQRGFHLLETSLNALIAVGGSSASDDEIEALNAGGHDPNRRGFTLQNVELTLRGSVDRYFDAEVNVVYFTDRDGESQFELEQAYADARSLPHGLRLRAGQYYTAFGVHNQQHPHSWRFVDMPFGWTRMFGPDGMRGVGAQLGWRLPTETALELIAGVQNANGETMSSFVNPEDEGHGHGDVSSTFGDQRPREVRSLDDLVWTGRATASFEPSDTWHLGLGASAAFGPNSAGGSADTSLFGADLAARWTPHDARDGFPFVEARFEYVARDYDFDAFVDEAGDAFGSGSLDDDTWYLQTVWGFVRDWTVAGRYERFDGDAPEEILGLEDRGRWSVAFTYSFSTSSKVRLQVNRDDSDVIDDATTVWLQFEFNLGAHGEHDEHVGDDHDAH
jgi:hypothetical protein